MIAHGTSRLTIFPPLEQVPDPPRPSRRTPRRRTGPRTHTCAPPPGGVIPQEVWAELSGAEILTRQLAGELPPPPLHHLTGLRLKELGEGWATFAMPRSEWLASPARKLQGGTIAMLADFAMLVRSRPLLRRGSPSPAST